MEDRRFERHQSAGWSTVATWHRRILLLLWVIFLLRAGFYLSFTPMWEGFDEHSHFASIQLMSVEGRLPVADQDRVSQEVYSSLKLAPLPWQPQGFGVGRTHDAYWRLDEAERRRLEAELRALDVSLGHEQILADQSNSLLLLYEGQHPPLYYMLCLIPYRLAGRLNLIDRVFLIRAFSVLIASGLIPLGFFLARKLLRDSDALVVVWIIAFLPGLMFDVVRVGNESLGVLLFTFLVLLSVHGVRSRMQAIMVGSVLGLGLLTKISFLVAAIPVGIALLLRPSSERPLRTRFGDVSLAALGAFAVSAWWYLLNYRHTGNWAGLYFTSVIHGWPLEKAAFEVDWLNAFNTIFSSHVWFGNWSFLKLRSWIYHVCTVAFLLGLTGAAVRVVKGFSNSAENRYRLLIAAVFYAFFWFGLGYYVLLTYVATNVAAIGGWYLGVSIACEVSVLFAGWAFLLRASAIRAGAAAALALTVIDLYGVFFLLIPYYTGFISHDARGSLSSFKPLNLSLADYGEVVSRLTANRPAFMTPEYFIGLTIVFLLIGLASVAVALRVLWRGERLGTRPLPSEP